MTFSLTRPLLSDMFNLRKRQKLPFQTLLPPNDDGFLRRRTRADAWVVRATSPSPPSRPHSGQHPPAGVKGRWWAGQDRGGHGRARHDTAPLEQTQSVQGDGLHWLSCCTGAKQERKREKKTVRKREGAQGDVCVSNPD